jgi:hypothetical protein
MISRQNDVKFRLRERKGIRIDHIPDLLISGSQRRITIAIECSKRSLRISTHVGI